MKRMVASVMALALTIAPVTATIAAGSGLPAHVVVLVDVSTSNPIVDNDEAAARIAGDVGRLIPELGEKSRVSVMLFGEYDARRATYREISVSVRFRPEAVKKSVVDLIATMPRLVREQKVKPQDATNLVGTLLDAASRVDCARERTVILVATDGQEFSKDYGQMPPKDQKPVFAGCPELHFVGVKGTSPKHTEALVAAWTRWSRQAGFAQFSAVR